VVVGYLYLLKRGDVVRQEIGPFEEIAEFRSPKEVGEILVLYAESGDGVLR
jgi:hypothetical protein